MLMMMMIMIIIIIIAILLLLVINNYYFLKHKIFLANTFYVLFSKNFFLSYLKKNIYAASCKGLVFLAISSMTCVSKDAGDFAVSNLCIFGSISWSTLCTIFVII